MARDDWFCTFGGALGTFRRFPDSSRHPRKMVARIYPPSPLSWCVYVCVRVHIFVCWKKRKWRRRIPPKKVKPEHAVVVAMLIIYFLKLFLFTIVLPSKSNISSAFHMYLFTFYGSFCSIPLLLLLRWGLFTINLLVFLFTE